jgi:hypothetical protein
VGWGGVVGGRRTGSFADKSLSGNLSSQGTFSTSSPILELSAGGWFLIFDHFFRSSSNAITLATLTTFRKSTFSKLGTIFCNAKTHKKTHEGTRVSMEVERTNSRKRSNGTMFETWLLPGLPAPGDVMHRCV